MGIRRMAGLPTGLKSPSNGDNEDVHRTPNTYGVLAGTEVLLRYSMFLPCVFERFPYFLLPEYQDKSSFLKQDSYGFLNVTFRIHSYRHSK